MRFLEQIIKRIRFQGGFERTTFTSRPMTDNEAKAFEAAFEKMDEAFDKMNEAFGEIDKVLSNRMRKGEKRG